MVAIQYFKWYVGSWCSLGSSFWRFWICYGGEEIIWFFKGKTGLAKKWLIKLVIWPEVMMLVQCFTTRSPITGTWIWIEWNFKWVFPNEGEVALNCDGVVTEGGNKSVCGGAIQDPLSMVFWPILGVAQFRL